jgi:hypothetical protein
MEGPDLTTLDPEDYYSLSCAYREAELHSLEEDNTDLRRQLKESQDEAQRLRGLLKRLVRLADEIDLANEDFAEAGQEVGILKLIQLMDDAQEVLGSE